MTNSLVKSAMKKSTPSPAPPKPRKPQEVGGAVPEPMLMTKEDTEYRAREDARTLHEAHKIRMDKSRLGAVRDHIMSMGEALGGTVKTTEKKMGRK